MVIRWPQGGDDEKVEIIELNLVDCSAGEEKDALAVVCVRVMKKQPK